VLAAFNPGCAMMVFFAAAALSAPQFETGNRLYANCLGGDSQQRFCEGFIVAVADELRVAYASFAPKAYLCIPGDVAVQQLKDVVVLYLERHPEERHLSAASLVSTALVDAFPCK
jgi:hypothetical protein